MYYDSHVADVFGNQAEIYYQNLNSGSFYYFLVKWVFLLFFGEATPWVLRLGFQIYNFFYFEIIAHLRSGIGIAHIRQHYFFYKKQKMSPGTRL